MSGGKNESQSSQGSETFIDPSQAPYLEWLRSQGQSLAGSQLGGGSQFQQSLGQQQNALSSFLQGPQENPYLMGQIQQGQDLINQNLQRNVLPGISSGAIQAGQFGGGRQGVAEGIAAGDAADAGSRFAQNLIGQDYQAQQQRALQALALAPSINQGAFSPLMNFGNLLGGPNNLARSSGSGDSQGKSLGF